MLRTRLAAAVLAAGLLLPSSAAFSADAAANDSSWGWFSGDWSLTLGAAGFVGPRYEGGKGMALGGAPVISLSRTGPARLFTSRNDNPGFSLYDNGAFRIGPVGKLLWPRDASTSNDLTGLHDVPFGVEAGLFAEYFPSDWLRLRAEVRQGFLAHHGLVADLSADAFTDLSPVVQISAGPRMSLASNRYFDAYYGVSPAESLASGLTAYDPGGGMKSVGVGGAVTWKATDKITTQLFGEYTRLTGPAADSSLVKERGSPNQFMIGVSATYRFDFHL